MIIKCFKCKQEFNTENVDIKIIKNDKLITCPECGVELKITNVNDNYMQLPTKQLLRKKAKIRMSKKERLSLRRALNDKI